MSFAEDSFLSISSKKTSTSAITEKRIDDQAKISSIPKVCKPNINRTQIFDRDNVSARIEKTVLRETQAENGDDDLLSPVLSYMKYGSILNDDLEQNLLNVLEKRPLDEERSPTFHHFNAKSIFMDDGRENRHHEQNNLLEVLEKRRKDEEIRSPTFHHIIRHESMLMDDREVRHHEQNNLLEVLGKRRQDEKIRSPTFHHIIQPESVLMDDGLRENRHHEQNNLLEVLEKRRQDEEIRSPTFRHFKFDSTLIDDSKNIRCNNDNCDKVKSISKSLIPSLNESTLADNRSTEDMSLFSSSSAIVGDVTNRAKISSGQSSELLNRRPRDESQISNQFLEIDDLTYPNCDPQSSTNFLLMKDLTFSSTNNEKREMKPSQRRLTFNDSGSTTMKKSSLNLSSQNNVNELCNLEPEHLSKQIDMKTVFLDISAAVDINKIENQLPVNNGNRCQKCINCRRSVDGNKAASFLKIEDWEELNLDLSVYNKFKGLATFAHVIEAHKKRRAAKQLAKQSLMDQNVIAPSWEMLWANKQKTTIVPKLEYIPEMLYCFPMRMNIEFLLKNKMTTEYSHWKYFDNYFYIGAIALRHEKIPSIRIHIKFDWKVPSSAEKLNIPLVFKRVFVEECPFYLKKISPRNYLKHKHALGMLPLDLTTMCSHSDRLYEALDQFDKWFENTIDKIKELELLVIDCEAFLKMDGRQCYIEHTVFDIRKYLIQEFVIKLDKIDEVGPRNVYFEPICETTDEFKNLPVGLPFLHAFLSNPKSFLLPFISG